MKNHLPTKQSGIDSHQGSTEHAPLAEANSNHWNRRSFLKLAGTATGAFAFGAGYRAIAQLSQFPDTGSGITVTAPEVQPYVSSPFILRPFTDPLPQPKAMKPGWRKPDGSLVPGPNPTIPAEAPAWTVRRSAFLADAINPTGAGVVVPGPGLGQQDVYGFHNAGDTVYNGTFPTLPQKLDADHPGTHQIWPVPGQGPNAGNFSRLEEWPAEGVPPALYHIRLQVNQHSFTSSAVRTQKAYTDKDGKLVPAGTVVSSLPPSTIYGFNGTFPGPMINVEYGKPALVRFENDLDVNPQNLNRCDFGAPDWAFLTHCHNGHTAPESDGNPHYMQINEGAYTPGDWVDNLYLNYPAGGNPSEMQSFLWFHDHRMHHTGANVYKGMVGLMPHYDPGLPDKSNPGQIRAGTGLDPGDETKGLHLPGVRVDNGDGSFDVKYDIPLGLYDCALDDGAIPHSDPHNGHGESHPEWWGKTFFRHWADHGFVGDIFTVNGTAYPVLHVEPRRYRFRFLGCSVSRIYELALMTSAAGPKEKPGTQGQWQIPDGVQWKPWTMIASMGGLLPQASVTDSTLIWPATRREFVVDFTGATGKEIYVTNVMEMQSGRTPSFKPGDTVDKRGYKVPLMKIVVDQPLAGPDNSAVIVAGTPLRPMPKLKNGTAPTLASTAALPHREFTLSRGGPDWESQWIINNKPFDMMVPLAMVVRDRPEVWTNKNAGGGWVHPMHMHMEEHTVLARKGSTLKSHPEDKGKGDVTNLEPAESVTFYRNFRTFTGRYVAHCHNLAHEDHNMMFGWTIVEKAGDMDITGTVTDQTGKPVAGAIMRMTGEGRVESIATDADGRYGFTGLVTGVYSVAAYHADLEFNPQWQTLDYVSGHDIDADFVGQPVQVPKLSLSRDGEFVKVDYTGTLQSADEITGVFTDVVDAARPYEVHATEAAKFFRSVIKP